MYVPIKYSPCIHWIIYRNSSLDLCWLPKVPIQAMITDLFILPMLQECTTTRGFKLFIVCEVQYRMETIESHVSTSSTKKITNSCILCPPSAGEKALKVSFPSYLLLLFTYKRSWCPSGSVFKYTLLYVECIYL